MNYRAAAQQCVAAQNSREFPCPLMQVRQTTWGSCSKGNRGIEMVIERTTFGKSSVAG